MNQRRGLESLAGRFAGHFLGRQPSEFFIEEREQLIGSPGFATFQRLQDARDFGHAQSNSKYAVAKEDDVRSFLP